MKVQIDRMDSKALWNLTSVNSTIDEFDFYECRSSYLEGQLIVSLIAGDSLSKEFPIPIETKNLDTIGFTIGDFISDNLDSLTFRIYSGAAFIEYKLNLIQKYNHYFFYLPFDTITKVEFKASTNIQYIIADLVCYKDEFPNDINFAIKEFVERYIPELPAVGICEKSIAKSSLLKMKSLVFAEKFSAITFGNETHHINSVSLNPKDNTFDLTFSDLFDGKKLKANLSFPDVRLGLPCLVNPKNIESCSPSISIEGGYDFQILPEKSFPGDDIVSEDLNGNFYFRRKSGFFKYQPVIHGLYRSLEIERLLSSIFTQFQGFSRPIWINGRRVILNFQNTEIVAFEDATGELQVQCEIEVGVYEWKTSIVQKQTKERTVVPQTRGQ